MQSIKILGFCFVWFCFAFVNSNLGNKITSFEMLGLMVIAVVAFIECKV